MNAEIEQRKKRFARIADLLACPRCGAKLNVSDSDCRCPSCQAVYPVRNYRVHFVEPRPSGDKVDSLKFVIRRLIGPWYRNVADIISPDFPVLRGRELRKAFNPASQLVIDCGAGSQRINPDVITLDFSDYEAVDIICDICARLPFVDGAVDGAVSWGVIEHLPAPDALVTELARCLKPGGKTIHMVPFMYHFHSSPHDFTRFTHQGLQNLFGGFDVHEVRNVSGPVSYFNLGAVEFLSTLLSFGSERLKGVLYLLLCGLTFPIKLLDLPFINRKAFLGMAPCLLVVAERRSR